MGVYNSWSPPPTPEPNPYPFSLSLSGDPGAHVPLFRVTPTNGEAAPWWYACEIESCFASDGAGPDRLTAAYTVSTETSPVVARTPGYTTNRQMTTAAYVDGALVVSLVVGTAVPTTFAGFITSRRLSPHGTTITMLL